MYITMYVDFLTQENVVSIHKIIPTINRAQS